MATWNPARVLPCSHPVAGGNVSYVKNCTFLEGIYARFQDSILFVAFPMFLPLMVEYRYEK